jgi:hypothetical protein
MVSYPNAYDSLADFMAMLDPKKVLEFHAPEAIQLRVNSLLEKQETTSLEAQEQVELDHYLILEHIVRLAKSRARLRLAQKAA